ncbi:MAG TPA: MFS transporter [Actinomycetota bacterium]|nr:MFS transporter [Actinomycetota bacterium]
MPTAAGETQPGLSFDGFKAVMSNRSFRMLFWGQAVSALGDWVGTLAFIAAADQLSGGNAFAITGVLVLRLVPTLFATPIGGVVADRFDRKRIMIWSDIARFAVILATPFVPNLIALYIFAFVHECFSLVFLPARDATIPNLVPADRLEPANALVMGSSFAGIPLSGPVYGAMAAIALHFPAVPTQSRWLEHPWGLAFVFDAFTFLLSAWFIARVTMPPREQRDGQASERFGAMLRGGIGYVRSKPILIGLSFAVSLGLLGGGVLFAKGISYVKETLGGNDVAFGYLMGIFGGGMVLGFVGSQFHSERGAMWTLRGALVAMGGVLITMALIPALWMAYIMASVFGLTFALAIIIGMTQAQLLTTDEMRGRVMAIVHILVRLALLVGAVMAAGIGAIFKDGLRVPGLNYRADSNQVALAIAGALIAAGVVGVRGKRERSG